MPRKLWIMNTERIAFRTSYGVVDFTSCVPINQQLLAAFELVDGNFEPHAGVRFGGEPKLFKMQFVVHFCGHTRLAQFVSQLGRLGSLVK